MGVSFFVKKSPGLPTSDDFSTGIDGWISFSTKTDNDAELSWSNESLVTTINTGSDSESDNARAIWDYSLSGNWDVQIDYENVSLVTGTGRVYHCDLLMCIGKDPNINFITIRWRSNSAVMQTFWYDGVTHDLTDASTAPGAFTANTKFRITKSGSIFTTYHDPGTGSWQQVQQFNIPGWENETFSPATLSLRSHTGSYQTRFDNFKVNSGTVVDLNYRTIFDDNPVGTIYNVNDTFGDWQVTQKAPSDFIEVVSSGLRFGNSTNDGIVFILNNNVLDSSEDFSIAFKTNKNQTQESEGGWNGLLLDNNTSSIDERIAVVYSPTPSAGMRIFKYVNGIQTNSIATGRGDDGYIFIAYTADTQTFKFFHDNVFITSLTQNFGGSVYQRLYSNNWTPNTPILDFTINNYKVVGSFI